MANIKARRLLSELYREGVEVRIFRDPETGKPTGKIGPFKDEQGRKIAASDDQVAMFIRPPDPVQRDMCMRAAQAKRAAALVAAKRDEQSEEHLTIMAFLADMSHETLIDYIVTGDFSNRRSEAEREVLSLEEWKDMTQYQDAMRQFQDMTPEELEGNKEWEALLELDDKYARQVAEREIQLSEAQRETLRFLQRDQLEKKALDRRAELVGSQAFMNEYERQMRFYSVRDVDNIDQLFFETAQELASQPDQVRELIDEALLPFIAEEEEAKNSSGAAEDGSASSALPGTPETSEPSIPEVVNA